MERHAYLIIAHNEFEVLKLLISMLDDERNDIYVHFDKKVKELPQISTQHSRLFILERRIDVRWGHVSQIQSELVLFETALKNGPYRYYHMISGTHLLLKSNDAIFEYFDGQETRNIFSNLHEDSEYQENMKLRSVNLFLRHYSSSNKNIAIINQFMWKLFLRIQRIIHYGVNKGERFVKASGWVHINESAVQLLVSRKDSILRKYRFSFCGDEFFVPSELLNSDLADTMVSRDDILYEEMGRSNPRSFHVSELDSLKGTGCLFARKFVL